MRRRSKLSSESMHSVEAEIVAWAERLGCVITCNLSPIGAPRYVIYNSGKEFTTYSWCGAQAYLSGVEDTLWRRRIGGR